MIGVPEYEQRELWRRKFPSGIAILLSIFQMILTLSVAGCEIAGDFVDFPMMNAFVGYWAFPFFMCAWISLSGAGCCCRTRCCGIATLVFQCFAIPIALCVVGLDFYFLNNPTQCFFSSDCSSYTDYYTSNYYYNYLTDTSNLYRIKVPLVKGQLAAGFLMFVSCVIFIVLYAVTSHRVQRRIHIQHGPPAPAMVITASNQYPPTIINPTYGHPLNDVSVNQYPNNPTASMNTIVCPNCQTQFQVSV
ncbi:unnamed protein product [Rotaria magnacalcarata]|uniref:Uncharacterized protein n=2 Tax=Rotaria magnacalcarata TaxID=392030 RepID=A0A816PMY9_9BILA|nr:unnamed protein product [Rotaria magnacalcarata]CAF1683602.1 unnamed protein product [Rotaria magnacalcarata]CAF2034225.1 unnamed protein product [Rotaria magnacalcarata]CAF2050537.1 unnamed protein product [Rotaria magnacalcarata]CAF3873950.1 unnamed protein product [Rotaria magnacalcarata]